MACAHIGIISLVAFAALAVAQDPTIETQVDVTQVDIGQNFHIRCIARNIEGGSSFLRVGKYFNEDPDPIFFATNAKIQDNFAGDGRFFVNVSIEAGTFTFLFSVNDARAEDSGRYTCGIYGSDGVIVEDVKEITVINIDDFTLDLTVTRISTGDTFTYKTGEEESHDLELDDSEQFSVEFQTSGSNPAPVVSVRVGSRDITDQFTVENTVEEFAGENSMLKGVKHSLKGSATIKVDHSFSRGMVVEASVNGEEQASETFIAKFSGFPPLLQDCATLLLAGDHESDVVYNCTFLSSDEPQVYFFYMRKLVGDTEKIDLFPGRTRNYFVKLVEVSPEEQKYGAILEMPRVFAQMFTDYSLVIGNSVGNVTHNFTVSRDPAKEFSGSSHVVVSMATLSLLTILSLLLSLV